MGGFKVVGESKRALVAGRGILLGCAAMKRFWLVYLLCIVAGTAVVYWTAPLARPYVARWRGAEGSADATARTDGSTAGRPAEPRDEAALRDVSPRSQPEQSAAPAGADEEAPPALLGIYRAATGDTPTWGVTGQRTTYYKLDGTRQGAVPGGVLFDVSRARQSSKGAMIECTFLHNGATNGPFLVSRKDVNLYTASHTKLSQRQLDALKTYYALNGKIGARKQELLQASAAKNPHFAGANAAYQRYLAHVNKAKELTERRDTVTGPERSQLEDQLREMKVAEVRLKAELEAANQKFREWKEQHAGEIAKPEQDPEIKRWSAEMADLRKAVPGLAL